MPFEYNTYIILDVPSPMAGKITAIRRRHRDNFRAALPVGITVAGSSGVGVLEPDQDPATVFTTLDTIAAETAPIEAHFGPVVRPPNTDLFVLTLADETPFRALHERIIHSGLRFASSPYPFQPHCTLRNRSPVSETEAAELLSLRLPEQFVLDTLSVYMVRQLPITLLHRVKLTNRAR